ncbi:AtpZ/AtpI family protein [Neptunitalea chrysea]|nr:AtpZ/AtpI family protein [Neptunitalea chrysea]
MGNQKNQHRKWIQFSQMGIEMAVLIVLSAFLGDWLDKKYTDMSPFFTVALSLFGVFLALYNVFRKVNAMNKED